VIRDLFGRVLEQARCEELLSKEHFSVDGTLIRARASHKSFVPRKGPKPPRGGSRSNPEVDFKGTRRTRETHVSSSDPVRCCSRNRARPARSRPTWAMC